MKYIYIFLIINVYFLTYLFHIYSIVCGKLIFWAYGYPVSLTTYEAKRAAEEGNHSCFTFQRQDSKGDG